MRFHGRHKATQAWAFCHNRLQIRGPSCHHDQIEISCRWRIATKIRTQLALQIVPALPGGLDGHSAHVVHHRFRRIIIGVMNAMQRRIQAGRHDRQLLPHDIAARITHLWGQLRKGLDQMVQNGQRFDDLVSVRADKHRNFSHRVNIGKLILLAVGV